MLTVLAGLLQAQTTVTVGVNSSSDDAEEYFFGPDNDPFRPEGSMDVTSSDIELGAENPAGKNPQVSGLRFTNLEIPQGSRILSAYIQFTVDNFDKNEDPAEYYIFAEDNANPVTFSENDFDITSRAWSMDSVAWSVAEDSWTDFGQAGSDQRTTDISGLVEALVNKPDWSPGNAMAFFIEGTGVREAESYDGSAGDAPQLVVTYLPVTSVSARVSSSSDDAEEYFFGPDNDPFRPEGSMDVTSSDIELGAEETNGKNPQVSGVRFAGLEIPRGAKILSAQIQFTVDNITKNEDPAEYYIFAENNPNPATFSETDFDITSRTWLDDSISWSVDAGTWNEIGAAGPGERTSDISALVQQLVNQPGWSSGGAMAFFVEGTGVREAESFDGSEVDAAQLMVSFVPVGTLDIAVAASSDDAEEYFFGPDNDPFRPEGSMDVTSSDIELGAENPAGKNSQISGLRFTNVELPANAVIESAYIQFTVDNTDKNEDPAEYYIFAEDGPNPVTFSETDFDITSRSFLDDSVAWNVAAGTWTEIGAAGADERTADITPLVTRLVSSPGWSAGNAMAFYIEGSGVREAESYDGDPEGAARLVVSYLQGEIIYNPELVREIPDKELVQGWDLSFDLNPFFRDLDSEITLSASVTETDTLPTGITFENGLLEGTFDDIGSFPITVTATSEGKSVSDEFILEYIAPSGEFTLAIFHNNDGESDLLPDSITVNGLKTTGGSIGQFKVTLDSLRNQADQRGYPSIMLSSGDNFLAGLEYNASQANGIYYDAIALDSLDYDAICIGNHDFDFGTTVLSELINSIQVNQAPYLSSNLGFGNVPELQTLVDAGRIAPYTILEREGEKIGIIGLTTPLLPIISSPGNTEVAGAIVDSTQKYVQVLADSGVNKVILISHLQGYDEDTTLASQISGVDIIIAGGGDELLTNDPSLGAPYSTPIQGAYPVVVNDADGKPVYLVTTPGNYRYLGNLLVEFDAGGVVTKVYQSDPVLVYGETDPDLVAFIEDPIRDYIGDLSTNVIAVAEDTLDFRREGLRGQETNGGNLFADALLWQANKNAASFGVNTPQVALQNSGGLRIESIIEPGDFTEDLTYEIAAFTNNLVVVEDITPEKFLELIEYGVAEAPKLDGRFPQIAGFEVVYYQGEPEGEPGVKSIVLDDGTVIVDNGMVADGAPDLDLATVDFTAGGGDGYPFAPLTFTTLGNTYQQAFRNYLADADGLNGVIPEADYPFGASKQRIIPEIFEVSAVPFVMEDFDETCPEMPEGWTEFNSGEDLISCGGGDTYIEFNGYAAGAGTSWLVTPRISFDLGEYQMTFDYVNQFNGPASEVLYSADYSGVGDPSAATWTVLTEVTDAINFDNGASDPQPAGEFDLSMITEEAYIGFRYVSNGTGGGNSTRLRLDNVAIMLPEPVIEYGEKTIPEIQGDSLVSPYVNGRVTTSGIVTAFLSGVEPYSGAGYHADLGGFTLQDATGDGNAATSDGIFVATDSIVAAGDEVELEAVVKEEGGMTVLTDLTALTIVSSGNTVPAATGVDLPLAGKDAFEAFEGMHVTFIDELTVTENRNLENFGEIRLSADGLLIQPTQVVDPNDVDPEGITATGNSNIAAVTAYQENNDANNFLLDDARGDSPVPVPWLDSNGTLLAGSTVSGLTGVLGEAFGNYRLVPNAAPQFSYADREGLSLPGGGGSVVTVAAFNVLNYFNGDGQGGGFPTSRGAATPEEFQKQTGKIVAAISAIYADVVGLMEIENDADDGFSAVKDLVDALNADAGSEVYDFISTGVIEPASADPDEIKVAFIYQPAAVTPVGDYAILTSEYDAGFNGDFNRPALAQTFQDNTTGEDFTAVVNHLKSKGSDCDDLGDPDDGDGQGNCNVTRTKAAGTMGAWLAGDPTGTGDEDFIILGDLNAYGQEDPIDTLRAWGYTNLVEDEYSYVFDGQHGTLDYAMANTSLAEKVMTAYVWNINSTEPDFLAYDGDPDAYQPDAYRSSDHDPVIVFMSFETIGTGEPVTANRLRIYPVPFESELNLSLVSEKAQRVTIEVYSALGARVYSERYDLRSGSNVITSDLSALESGVYVVRISELNIQKTVVKE